MSNENNNRQALLDEAKQLGLKFPNNITNSKLQEMITTDKGTTKSEETIEVPVDVIKQLQAQIDELKKHEAASSSGDSVDALVQALNINSGNAGMRIPKGIAVEDTPNREIKIARALTLIRCTVIPRDPSKVNQKAEVITMSNDLIGDLKYKVPFNLETHIPLAIYKVLESKKVNIFDDTLVSGDKATGETMGGYKSISAYSINILPKLTEAELKALARKQRLRSESLDERENAILDEEPEEEVQKSKLELAGYDL